MRLNLKFFTQMILFASAAALVGAIFLENPLDSSQTAPPMRVGCVPEMDSVEVEGGWQNRMELSAAQKKQFQAEWVLCFGEVKEFLTPERVREISRWSHSEMEHYRYVSLPNPEKNVWKTLGHDEGGKHFLLETPLETLPSETGMKRDLTAYALFNAQTEKIEWVLVTIRSQLVYAQKERRFWLF